MSCDMCRTVPGTHHTTLHPFAHMFCNNLDRHDQVCHSHPHHITRDVCSCVRLRFRTSIQQTCRRARTSPWRRVTFWRCTAPVPASGTVWRAASLLTRPATCSPISTYAACTQATRLTAADHLAYAATRRHVHQPGSHHRTPHTASRTTGPLLYHFDDNHGAPSLELSFAELRRAMVAMGFVFEVMLCSRDVT